MNNLKFQLGFLYIRIEVIIFVYNYLEEKINVLKEKEVGSIVLGCTHYPFIKEKILDFLNKDIEIIDGSLGTARQVERLLIENNIKNNSSKPGKIEIFNSSEDEKMIELSYDLLNR